MARGVSKESKMRTQIYVQLPLLGSHSCSLTYSCGLGIFGGLKYVKDLAPLRLRKSSYDAKKFEEEEARDDLIWNKTLARWVFESYRFYVKVKMIIEASC